MARARGLGPRGRRFESFSRDQFIRNNMKDAQKIEKDYLDFENFVTKELLDKWEQEPSEELRAKILKARAKCFRLWCYVGKPIPLTFKV